MKYSTSVATITGKIDVYSGVENSVKKSKEFGEFCVPEQNYKISMINEFLGKLLMVNGRNDN